MTRALDFIDSYNTAMQSMPKSPKRSVMHDGTVSRHARDLAMLRLGRSWLGSSMSMTEGINQLWHNPVGRGREDSEKTISVFQLVGTQDYPRDAAGELLGLIHPALQVHIATCRVWIRYG